MNYVTILINNFNWIFTFICNSIELSNDLVNGLLILLKKFHWALFKFFWVLSYFDLLYIFQNFKFLQYVVFVNEFIYLFLWVNSWGWCDISTTQIKLLSLHFDSLLVIGLVKFGIVLIHIFLHQIEEIVWIWRLHSILNQFIQNYG